MNETAPNTVARATIPLLVTLVQSRKQARWQWKHCAHEHKHLWTAVIDILDDRIKLGEDYLSNLMGIPGFRIKREIVE